MNAGSLCIAINTIRFLAVDAVKAGKLAQNAVTTNRLRDGSVSGSKIVNGAVGAPQLGNNAVNTSAIANNAAIDVIWERWQERLDMPAVIGESAREWETEASPVGVSFAEIAPFAAYGVLLRQRVKNDLTKWIFGVMLDGVDADGALLAGAVSDHQPDARQLLLAEHMPIGERDPKSGALDLDAVNVDLRDRQRWRPHDNNRQHCGDTDDCALDQRLGCFGRTTASTATPFSSPNPEPTAATALELSELRVSELWRIPLLASALPASALLVNAFVPSALLVRALPLSALPMIALVVSELGCSPLVAKAFKVIALKVSEAFAGAAAASNAPSANALRVRRVWNTMITPFNWRALRWPDAASLDMTAFDLTKC